MVMLGEDEPGYAKFLQGVQNEVHALHNTMENYGDELDYRSEKLLQH